MKHLSFAILAVALGAFPVAATTENPFVDVVPYAGRKRLDKSLVTRTDNPDGTFWFSSCGTNPLSVQRPHNQCRAVFEPMEVDLGRLGKLRLDSYELRYLR